MQAHKLKLQIHPLDNVDPDTLIVVDPEMQRLYDEARQLAPARLPVLIVGETGVGKEHLSELIHLCSGRESLPFVRINCAAISDNLFESELFGHERGSFTGADRTKQGLLEAAGEGTVLLDEIGELPLIVQAKLLRALEARAAPRVGGLASRPVAARFIGASNRDLEKAVEEGWFRRDLYHRIAGARLWVPPLRQRPTEILPLAQTFVRLACRELRRPTLQISADAGVMLQAHSWPGNIRELRNAIEHAVLLAGDGEVLPEHLRIGPAFIGELTTDRVSEHANAVEWITPRATATIDPVTPPRTSGRQRANRDAVQEALAACGGNQTLAAAQLGVNRRTLARWLDRMDIIRPRKGRPPVSEA